MSEQIQKKKVVIKLKPDAVIKLGVKPTPEKSKKPKKTPTTAAEWRKYRRLHYEIFKKKHENMRYKCNCGNWVSYFNRKKHFATMRHKEYMEELEKNDNV